MTILVSCYHYDFIYLAKENRLMTCAKQPFVYSQENLKNIAQFVLDSAKKLGASDAAMEVAEGNGFSVTVRQNEVETIEYYGDKSVAVTVFIGKKRGNASTADFSNQALEDTVKAAYNIAKFTAEDECAALAEADLLEQAPPDLKLFSPWSVTTQEAVEIARRAEAAAFETDACIVNSDGAGVSTSQSHFVLANSRGFMQGFPISRHTLSCSPIAGYNQSMQRDDWYSSERDATLLRQPEAIGHYAAKRALARLQARPITTRKCPVLFEAPIAAGLLGSLVQALSGGALYRGTTFLANSLNKKIFPSHINLLEDAHVIGGPASAPFDNDGVRTSKRLVIEAGEVNGYFLSCYSARKLGMQTTGNAGGAHNLYLTSNQTQANDDFSAMLKKLGTGLLVTDLMGQGVNIVTGDYSRGASGFWVEQGEIAFPVEEITIASTLETMFNQVVAIGADTLVRGCKHIGSILIEEMTIAGRSVA